VDCDMKDTLKSSEGHDEGSVNKMVRGKSEVFGMKPDRWRGSRIFGMEAGDNLHRTCLALVDSRVGR
jgi:hypothetical protein